MNDNCKEILKPFKFLGRCFLIEFIKWDKSTQNYQPNYGKGAKFCITLNCCIMMFLTVVTVMYATRKLHNIYILGLVIVHIPAMLLGYLQQETDQKLLNKLYAIDKALSSFRIDLTKRSIVNLFKFIIIMNYIVSVFLVGNFLNCILNYPAKYFICLLLQGFSSMYQTCYILSYQSIVQDRATIINDIIDNLRGKTTNNCLYCKSKFIFMQNPRVLKNLCSLHLVR